MNTGELGNDVFAFDRPVGDGHPHSVVVHAQHGPQGRPRPGADRHVPDAWSVDGAHDLVEGPRPHPAYHLEAAGWTTFILWEEIAKIQ